MQTISSINKMIESLSVNTFDDINDEKLFDSYFEDSNIDVFVIVVNNFVLLKENSYKRNKLLSLITNYIYNKDILKSLLLKTCHFKPNESLIIGHKLETIMTSIPDIVSNNIQSINCHKFDRNLYFKRVVEVIDSCVVEVYHWINSGIDCSLQFMSSLMGRIAFIGFSTIVWNQLLTKLIKNCENDFIWRRIAYRLIISTQKDQYLEVLIKTIFSFIPNYESIVWIIGKSAETNTKIKFLVVNKFLLINEFKSDLILINIFGYLSSNSLKLYFEAFHNLLNAWSNSSAIKYRSHSQHLYLSRGLMIGSTFMKNIDFNQFKDIYRKLTMNGIEVHLKNSQKDMRDIGLTVGQNLMTLFSPDSQTIGFEIEENEELKYLNDLFNNCNQNIERNIEQNISKEVEKSSETTEIIDKQINEIENRELDSDDDDNDLIPYDMSNDTPIEKVKKPIYLRDCMQGLIDYEKTEWMQSCLQNAELIIRSNSDSVSEVAIELIKILLNLEDKCAVPDFIGLRLRAMIALCVCSPKSVASYLSSQFYQQNHTIRQRLDILEVLLSASQELSSNTQKANKPHMSELSLAQKEVIIAEKHWTEVIKSRTDAKTRVLSHKTKTLEENAFINRFAQFAGYFFFPLMKNISGNDIKFDLLEEDHYVFGRLLYTLGIMIKNVSLTPISKQMGKELIEFILTFRYHCEV
jgi:telomere length regulation protein